jgi:hypothetical protein
MRPRWRAAPGPAPVVLAALALVGCGDAGAPNAEGRPGEVQALSATTEEGPVRATVELTPREPRLGDPLTLTLTVEAQADVTVEMPVFGEALGRFSIVDFTPRERAEPDGRTVASQRYTLQAPMSGRQRIPPLRIEFLDRRPGQAAAGQDAEYRELLTDELAVAIASVLPDSAVTDELRPARPALRERRGVRWLTALGAAVIVAAMAALSLYLRGRSLERARVTAYDRALRRMSALEARGLPGAEEADAWYVELSDIVRRYLEDRYGVRAPELTTEEFLQEARRSAELSLTHRELLSAFLERCDRVKFAAYQPEPSESKEALATSRRFLEETRVLPDQPGAGKRAA